MLGEIEKVKELDLPVILQLHLLIAVQALFQNSISILLYFEGARIDNVREFCDR